MRNINSMSSQNRQPDAEQTLRVQQLFVQHQRRLRAFVLRMEQR
jgi:hypothetical protein